MIRSLDLADLRKEYFDVLTFGESPMARIRSGRTMQMYRKSDV